MTRKITPHKGGRTARPPHARITPATRAALDAALAAGGVSMGDWIEQQLQRSKTMDATGMAVRYKSGTMVTDLAGVVEQVEYKNGRPSFFVRWSDGTAGWYAPSNIHF